MFRDSPQGEWQCLDFAQRDGYKFLILRNYNKLDHCQDFPFLSQMLLFGAWKEALVQLSENWKDACTQIAHWWIFLSNIEISNFYLILISMLHWSTEQFGKCFFFSILYKSLWKIDSISSQIIHGSEDTLFENANPFQIDLKI